MSHEGLLLQRIGRSLADSNIVHDDASFPRGNLELSNPAGHFKQGTQHTEGGLILKQAAIIASLALTLILGACSKDEPARTAKVNDKPAAEGAATAAVMTTNDPSVVKIAVPTMQCEDCANTISKAVKEVPGTRD